MNARAAMNGRRNQRSNAFAPCRQGSAATPAAVVPQKTGPQAGLFYPNLSRAAAQKSSTAPVTVPVSVTPVMMPADFGGHLP